MALKSGASRNPLLGRSLPLSQMFAKDREGKRGNDPSDGGGKTAKFTIDVSRSAFKLWKRL